MPVYGWADLLIDGGALGPIYSWALDTVFKEDVRSSRWRRQVLAKTIPPEVLFRPDGPPSVTASTPHPAAMPIGPGVTILTIAALARLSRQGPFGCRDPQLDCPQRIGQGRLGTKVPAEALIVPLRSRSGPYLAGPYPTEVVA